MVNGFAVQPEIPDLLEDRYSFTNKGFNSVFELGGTNFCVLELPLTIVAGYGVPNIEAKTQEDDKDFQRKQEFLESHDDAARRTAVTVDDYSKDRSIIQTPLSFFDFPGQEGQSRNPQYLRKNLWKTLGSNSQLV